jgi:Glycosyl hydrolase catalytic core
VPRNTLQGARAVGVFALTAALVSAQTLGVNNYGFAASDAQLLQQLSPSPVPLRMTFYWHNVSHAPNYYDPQVAAATAAGVPILGILGYSSWNESSMPANFDFTELSPFTISWHTARGPLPWGSAGRQGTAKYLWDATLEDGRTYPRVVALHPTQQGGFIHGGVAFQVPAGHSVVLWAKAGFEQGANPNARANFSITYLDGNAFPCLSSIAKGPDGALTTLTADISKLAGASLEIFFNVDPVLGYPMAPAIWQSAGILVDGVPLTMAQVVRQNIQSVINYPPKDPDAFAAYAAALATRYPQIQSWEIWNEPNTSFFWRPAVGIQAFTNLLQKTYRAVKDANPKATVILGGLSPGTSSGVKDSIPAADFLNMIYQNGGGASFDAVAYHAYGNGPLENWLADALGELRSVMHRNADDAKSIWITEMGCYTHGPGSVSETWQAEYLTKSITFLAGIPYLERVYWYTLRDGNSSASPEMNYGLFRADGTPKLAVKAFSAALGN